MITECITHNAKLLSLVFQTAFALANYNLYAEKIIKPMAMLVLLSVRGSWLSVMESVLALVRNQQQVVAETVPSS